MHTPGLVKAWLSGTRARARAHTSPRPQMLMHRRLLLDAAATTRDGMTYRTPRRPSLGGGRRHAPSHPRRRGRRAGRGGPRHVGPAALPHCRWRRPGRSRPRGAARARRVPGRVCRPRPNFGPCQARLVGVMLWGARDGRLAPATSPAPLLLMRRDHPEIGQMAFLFPLRPRWSDFGVR